MKKPSPETLRRLRRIGTGVGAFLLVFIVALYVWFPYDRAKEDAINMAAAQGFDVEIESAGRALGGGGGRARELQEHPRQDGAHVREADAIFDREGARVDLGSGRALLVVADVQDLA